MSKIKKPWSIWLSDTGGIFSSNRSKTWNNEKKCWEIPNMKEVPGRDYEFVATLKLVRFYHGRSCHFYFKDLNSDNEFLMQGTQMEEILFNHTLYEGVICGRWGVLNRGGTISIKLIEELDEA